MYGQLKSNSQAAKQSNCPVKRRWGTFLVGLVVGLVLPTIVTAVCNVLLIADVIGWNRFGACSRAMKAMNRGDYQHAIEWANRAIQYLPDSGMGFRARAEAQELAGNLEKAVADYTVTLAYDESSHDVYVYRAHVFEKLGMRSQAAIDYSQYIVSLHDTMPDRQSYDYALDRRPVFGQEPVRSIADLAKFLDNCDAHTKQLPVVKRASEILRNANSSEYLKENLNSDQSTGTGLGSGLGSGLDL